MNLKIHIFLTDWRTESVVLRIEFGRLCRARRRRSQTMSICCQS